MSPSCPGLLVLMNKGWGGGKSWWGRAPSRPTIGTSEALALELWWVPQDSSGLLVDRRSEARSTAAGTRRHQTQPASSRVRGGTTRQRSRRCLPGCFPYCLTASSCLFTGFGEDSSLPERLRPRRHGEVVVSFLSSQYHDERSLLAWGWSSVKVATFFNDRFISRVAKLTRYSIIYRFGFVCLTWLCG